MKGGPKPSQMQVFCRTNALKEANRDYTIINPAGLKPYFTYNPSEGMSSISDNYLLINKVYKGYALN